MAVYLKDVENREDLDNVLRKYHGYEVVNKLPMKYIDYPVLVYRDDDKKEVVFYKNKEDSIKPKHYNKGEIDLYESWYLTRPFNEFRAIMESVAERYMKRDKLDRLEDLDKCMETLRRLREYEVRHKGGDE